MMEKWWDNAKDWVKVLICIVVSIVSIALIILTMIMPIVWSIKLHNPAFLLLWASPPVSLSAYGLTKSFLISK